MTAADLAATLRIGVMRLSRRLRAERADHGLTLTQLATLAALDRLGPATPGALADAEKVRPPSMTRVLTGLEELQLVRRTRDATDGRRAIIELTPAARALLKDDRRRREAWLAKQLSAMTADERAVLQAALPLMDRLAQS
jgi:DNA-binding MarR family transcriptional regulator